ncbi:flagellar basal body-associated FliL family protein [Curvibacter delicatus]|uniref:flagellar basal body-associated FliL family protein n=1 Tax=Curvibacter delicatus TaxID=80879 RepID=UPI001FE03910|nr:flagellar basal body-associated FliL family protein [Curvibacter delicatus]
MSAKPEADEAVKPPKSKKMLLIILAAVLLLVLGGGGGWFYLSKKNADLEDEEEEVAHVAPKGPPTYLPMDHMVVNLADPGGEKVAQVGVTLELSDIKAPERVKPYLPAIRSSVLMLVSQRTAEELLQREGKEKLAADILAEASRHFEDESPAGGKGKKNGGKAKKGKPEEGGNPVRGVLFSSFIVQ